MKKKIVTINILITTFALLLVFLCGCLINRNAIYSEAQNNIVSITEIFKSNYNEDLTYIHLDDPNIRETIIDKNGVVLLDSKEVDVSKMENHLDREEIQYALNGNPQTVIRKSSTLNEELMYYAIKVDTTNSYVFIRTSLTISNINSFVYDYLPYMIIAVMVVIIGSIAAILLLSRVMVKPLETIRDNLDDINNGTYKATIPTTKDASINKILVEINDLSSKLDDNIKGRQEEKDKLNYFLNNISDAVVVFDFYLNILLMNKNATSLFMINDAVGKNYKVLSRDVELNKKLDLVLKNHKKTSFEFKNNSRYYLVQIETTNDSFVLMVLTDITSEKDSELVRTEFFSNASHELKTPLTSIKGFNELIKIKNQDVKLDPYISQIEKESDRMLNLIDDMLSLSKLESRVDTNKEKVDVLKVAKEVKESLNLIAKEKDIKVTIKGKLELLMEKDDLYKLLKNLIENSIKYNNKKGHVEVLLSEDTKNKYIKVVDDGYGIDEKDLPRIFERFYRVDESRNRSTGGTGLGLSIVKHIVQLYDGKINVSSKVGNGTTIEVVFNK